MSGTLPGVSLTATGSPRSIGCATDVLHAAFDGDVVDRGDYWVLRTPTKNVPSKRSSFAHSAR